MEIDLEKSWTALLKPTMVLPYYIDLMNFVESEYSDSQKKCFPPKKLIFNAFNQTPVSEVKVVIIGQDPYHGLGQANGLCFSVNKEIKIPPSLQNIYKALNNDIDKEIPEHGDLSHWSQQGVLMLNATMTVEEGKAGSHQNKGWETFTDFVIEKLSEEKINLVFLLWGSYAQSKSGLISDKKNHLILKSSHPSPLSAYRGFLESKHFSKTNTFLKNNNLAPIDW